MNAQEVLDRTASRGLMPTGLSSREIRNEISSEIRLRALFISRGTNVQFLSKLAEVLDAYLSGEMNDATARLELLRELQRLGYTPEGGFPDDLSVPPAEAGSIRDISSAQRLQLILDTQAQLMFGAGQKAAGELPQNAYDYPAWELIRLEHRKVPRGMKLLGGALIPVFGEDWPSRWRSVGGTLVSGRMIALKEDDIWAALGNSANFNDALDTTHPPFAFNSGMGWRAITRTECITLGLIENDWKPEGFQEWRINEDAKIGVANIPKDLIEAAKKELNAQLEGSTLRIRESRGAARAAYAAKPVWTDKILQEVSK